MYTYHCHNTKHVHVPLSQYKTCKCTTRHCKYYCLPSGYWSSGVFRCGNLRFRSCCSSNSKRLDDKGILYLYWNNEIVDLSWYTLYRWFSLRLNTLKRILIVQLTFLNFNYKKKIISTFIRVPPFENKCLKGHYVPSQRGPWIAGHIHGDSMFHIHDT
jgi:hypothetical protein